MDPVVEVDVLTLPAVVVPSIVVELVVDSDEKSDVVEESLVEGESESVVDRVEVTRGTVVDVVVVALLVVVDEGEFFGDGCGVGLTVGIGVGDAVVVVVAVVVVIVVVDVVVVDGGLGVVGGVGGNEHKVVLGQHIGVEHDE
jgi:hypothetical protein